MSSVALSLTPKQERFCEEYLVDLNGRQAAIRAGYSVKSAGVQAHENLKKYNCQERVTFLKQQRSQRLAITQDNVLAELARIAFSDLRNVFTPEGGLRSPDEWDNDTAASISSVEVVTSAKQNGDDEPSIIERTHKIKVWDKTKAAELLGKHLGIFGDKQLPPLDPEAKGWTIQVIVSEKSKANADT